MPVITHPALDRARVIEPVVAKCGRRVDWNSTGVRAFAYSILWELVVTPYEPALSPFTTQAESIIEAGLARPGIRKEAAEQAGSSPEPTG
ncbi:MAG: hypothetical protein KF884_00120 [Fimbriimonadaceae bacterium]|nr:hypothetical protein [Fimbriimonadaceae bacterium]QYK58500.1 MAG: hypothetical protein KF884_00120 [Fimbriimonadaceae bacterium]